MSPGKEVEIERTFVRETDAAVLISVDDEDHWIPLSQVSSMHKGPKSTIVMSQWIANQKGLIE